MKKTINIVDGNISFKSKLIFNKINISISKPGAYLICGENGSGKTTLLKIINKSLRIKALAFEVKDSILVDPLHPVFNNLSVMGNFLYSTNDKEKISSFINKFDLDLDLNTKCIKLSMGEKIKVGIIRAILSESDILLFDEVFSPLDIEFREKLYNIIDELSKTKIVILTSNIDSDKSRFNSYYIENNEITVNNEGIFKTVNKKTYTNLPLIKKCFGIRFRYLILAFLFVLNFFMAFFYSICYIPSKQMYNEGYKDISGKYIVYSEELLKSPNLLVKNKKDLSITESCNDVYYGVPFTPYSTIYNELKPYCDYSNTFANFIIDDTLQLDDVIISDYLYYALMVNNQIKDNIFISNSYSFNILGTYSTNYKNIKKLNFEKNYFCNVYMSMDTFVNFIYNDYYDSFFYEDEQLMDGVVLYNPNYFLYDYDNGFHSIGSMKSSHLVKFNENNHYNLAYSFNIDNTIGEAIKMNFNTFKAYVSSTFDYTYKLSLVDVNDNNKASIFEYLATNELYLNSYESYSLYSGIDLFNNYKIIFQLVYIILLISELIIILGITFNLIIRLKNDYICAKYNNSGMVVNNYFKNIVIVLTLFIIISFITGYFLKYIFIMAII